MFLGKRKAGRGKEGRERGRQAGRKEGRKEKEGSKQTSKGKETKGMEEERGRKGK